MSELRAATRAALAGCCVAGVLTLAACGGGGDSATPPAADAASSTGNEATGTPSSTTTSTTTPSPADGAASSPQAQPAEYLTVPAYAALPRAAAGASAPQVLTADQRQQRVLAWTSLAAEALWPLDATAVGVAPPLALSQLDLLRATSTGATRAQVDALWAGLEPVTTVSGTSAVDRQVRGASGQELAYAVLRLTDQGVSPAQSPAHWSGDEQVTSDPTLRMTADDRLSATLAWDGVAFDGQWGAGGEVYAMPMVRLQTGVTRHVGTDYQADAYSAGGRTLLLLQPTAATLDAFGAARLVAAVTESLPLLQAAGAPAGEIVLPASLTSVGSNLGGWLSVRGVSLPYDEVNADMHTLDRDGGVYATTTWSPAQVAWSATGMQWATASSTVFRWTSANTHQSGGVVTTLVNPAPFGNCPAVDQRPFFALLLADDATTVQVLWAAAVQRPPFTASCAPGLIIQPGS